MVNIDDLGEIKLDNVKMILDEYALKFQELVKRNITNKDERGWNHVASTNLLASIHTSIEIGNEKYTVYLHSKEYLKYLENGTKPHWPPTKPILEWVRNKKLPTKESTGDKTLPTEKQLTYLIRKKISEDGTNAYPIVANTQQELNEIYAGKLVEALEKDIHNWLPIIHIQLHFK